MATQADLDALDEAIRLRRLGKGVASISGSGVTVSYAAMTLAEMESARTKLVAEIAGTARRRAIRPFFGG